MEEKIIYDIEVEGVESIESLTKANKALREERNKLNLQSEEGLKRSKEINKQLDANTEKIKDNSSAIEKQRLNVGNYTGALDKLVPGLGATANGFTAMKTTAMAFIATPIGAVIGALGLALGALTAYFKGSEEGQDSLAKVMNVGKVVFEQVTVVVEKLGEVVFKTISFVSDLAMKVINFVAPAVGEALQQSIDAANKITELEDTIDARENELIVKRAENAKKVAMLREQALKLEGDAKRKVIQEAIDLEKQLAKEETFQAAERLALLEEQIKVGGNATEEQKKQRADLTAAKIKAETEEYSSTLRFQKEIEKLNEEEAKKRKERNELLAEEKRIKEDLAEVNDRLAKQTEVELPALDLKIKKTADLGAALDNLKKKNEETNKQTQENAKVAQKASEDQIKSAVALSAAVIGLGKADTKAKKGLGLTTIAINSGIGVSEAVKAGAGKPWPLNLAAILSGITAVLTGITQAKGLLGFAYGGITGTRIMGHHGTPISRSNGDNLLATVRTGEVILNQRQQAALGGDRTFARIGVPGFATGGIVSSAAQKSESISNQFALYEAIANLRPVVTVEDINMAQNRVFVVEDRARLS